MYKSIGAVFIVVFLLCKPSILFWFGAVFASQGDKLSALQTSVESLLQMSFSIYVSFVFLLAKSHLEESSWNGWGYFGLDGPHLKQSSVGQDRGLKCPTSKGCQRGTLFTFQSDAETVSKYFPCEFGSHQTTIFCPPDVNVTLIFQTFCSRKFIPCQATTPIPPGEMERSLKTNSSRTWWGLVWAFT